MREAVETGIIILVILFLLVLWIVLMTRRKHIREFAWMVPSAIHAVFQNGSAAALNLQLIGFGPERLCYPLSHHVLKRIHACAATTKKEVQVEYVPHWKEWLRYMTFRVRYDFEGTDEQGTLSIHEEGFIRVKCGASGTYGHFRQAFLSHLEGWRAHEAGK